MKKIDYEKEVKTVYPTAKRVGVGINGGETIFHMIIGCGLGENYSLTPAKAWRNAYKKAVANKKGILSLIA